MNRMQHMAFALIAMLIASTLAIAAPTKKELQARFEQRYPQIRTLKSEGKVGETSAGFIEAVKSSDAAMSKLIDEENADRRALYEIIAKEQKIEVDAVAATAAQRNFQKAKPGEYLKENGTWRKK